MNRWKSNCLILVMLEIFMLSNAQALDIETLVMPGEVIAGHAKFESECSACHEAFSRERQNSLCTDCHTEIGADQFVKRGYHGLYSDALNNECASCHVEHKGRDANVINLDVDTFDHLATDFALLGEHETTVCDDCHEPLQKYRDAPSTCIGCHRSDDVHEEGLGEDCASCHNSVDWAQVEFDHSAETSFLLDGAHTEAACVDCHIDQIFTDTPVECVACHKDDDVHENRNGDVCSDCHSTTNWEDSFFDHNRQTDFVLSGQHQSVDCAACHVSAELPGDTCINCHSDDDAHEGLLGAACADCHNSTEWQASLFDHQTTRFPLFGGHVEVACQSCHVNELKQNLPGVTCIDCHADDDPHDGQLGDDCASCHNETDWLTDVRFDHDFTAFPLLGAHKDAACADCHADRRFADTPSDCVDCHRQDDIHQGVLGADCATCHTPVDWQRSLFDHALASGFRLSGAHADATCRDCHRTPPAQSGGARSRCVDCHRSDDIHRGEFGQDCARCHSTDTFAGAEERQ